MIVVVMKIMIVVVGDCIHININNMKLKNLLNERKINEASKIDYEELDLPKQILVTKLEGFFDGRMQTLYGGIHGNIVEIKVGIGGTRLTKGDLKELATMNIRWIEYDNRIVSVGF